MTPTAIEDRIRQLFGTSIEAKIAAADMLPACMSKATERLVNCLLNDRKVLVCGHGSSIANAQHFSSALMNHYEVERPALPTILLNADLTYMNAMMNEGHYHEIFARQIQSVGQEGDVLLIVTTLGHVDPLLHAVDAANDRGVDIIALTGRDGGMLASHLGPEDIEIRVPQESQARIRECHLFILHTFCELIDQILFGHMQG